MTILVTGGTGFLGRHVLDLLLARPEGEEVRVLARRADELDAVGVVPFAGSVLDADAVGRAAAGCRLVLHLAGRVAWGTDAPELFPLHVEGTRNVVRAAREAGAKRLVHVSTSGAVGISGDLDHVATEESPYALEVARRWPYYLSKIYAEKVALEEAARGGIEVVVVSPALLLGPGAAEPNEVVARYLRREIPAVPPGVASIVDVRDAAEMVLAAAEKGRPGARYLLGTNVDFAELFELLEKVSGVARPRLKVPARARAAVERATQALGAVERAVGYSGEEAASLAMAGYSWAVSSDRARAELGFAPRPLDETLAEAVLAVESEARPRPRGVLSFASDGLHRITGRLARRAAARPPEDEAHPDRSS